MYVNWCTLSGYVGGLKNTSMTFTQLRVTMKIADFCRIDILIVNVWHPLTRIKLIYEHCTVSVPKSPCARP